MKTSSLLLKNYADDCGSQEDKLRCVFIRAVRGEFYRFATGIRPLSLP